jgi:hypothetical protein
MVWPPECVTSGRTKPICPPIVMPSFAYFSGASTVTAVASAANVIHAFFIPCFPFLIKFLLICFTFPREFVIRAEPLHLPCQLAIQRESFAFHKQNPRPVPKFRDSASQVATRKRPPHDRAPGEASRRNVRVDVSDALPTHISTLARRATLITVSKNVRVRSHERARLWPLAFAFNKMEHRIF